MTQSLSCAQAAPPADELLDVLPVVDDDVLPVVVDDVLPVLPDAVDVPPVLPVIVDVLPVVFDVPPPPAALDGELLAPPAQLATPTASPAPTNTAS